ncbi:hypothetical protein [Peribacillus butanolivorans]|uniref:hypothetical protein n=1 Tax=Peribacillus butanolivorans TaxID=421767 RepID=UPI0036DCDCB7
MTREKSRVKHEENIRKGKKACCRCKEVKLFEDFSLSRSTPDGRAKRCSECDRENYLANRPPLKGRLWKWKSKEIILYALKKAFEEGLTLTGIFKKYPTLYAVILRDFGTMKQAVKELGYDYYEIKQTQGRTHEDIRKELLIIQEQHGYISYKLMNDDYRNLEGSISNRFGTIFNAIQTLGIEH